jgi:hypothetical protein
MPFFYEKGSKESNRKAMRIEQDRRASFFKWVRKPEEIPIELSWDGRRRNAAS